MVVNGTVRLLHPPPVEYVAMVPARGRRGVVWRHGGMVVEAVE